METKNRYFSEDEKMYIGVTGFIYTLLMFYKVQKRDLLILKTEKYLEDQYGREKKGLYDLGDLPLSKEAISEIIDMIVENSMGCLKKEETLKTVFILQT